MKKEILKLINKIRNDPDYYSLTPIKERNARYNVIFGERSDGKSFAVEFEGLVQYLDSGAQMSIVRRYDMDFTNKSGVQTTFEHFISNKKYGNILKKISDGKWCDITYYAGAWYLCTYTEKGARLRDTKPFCYGFALSNMEHNKSTSYPRIELILFDEFLTRDAYLPDEFILFQNVLSTIIRDRDNVTIYMCGNTVNKYSIYFKEMGLDNVQKMEQGQIDVYEFAVYKDNKMTEQVLRIAVEFSGNRRKNGKESDVYFSFNNPKLKMITGGLWEIAIYPHLPENYTRDDIIFEYFVMWEGVILHCEIIEKENKIFTYIHKKTTFIKYEDADIIFSVDYHEGYNYRRRLTKPFDDIGKKIYWFYQTERVFYQDNEVGEIMRNYLQWSKTDRGII